MDDDCVVKCVMAFLDNSKNIHYFKTRELSDRVKDIFAKMKTQQSINQQLLFWHNFLLNGNVPPYTEHYIKYFTENSDSDNVCYFTPYDEFAFDAFFADYENVREITENVLFGYVLLLNNFYSTRISACSYAMTKNRTICHFHWCCYLPYVTFVKEFVENRRNSFMFLFEQTNENAENVLNDLVFGNEYVVWNVMKFL